MDPHPTLRIMLTPQGRPFNQAVAQRLAAQPRLLIICGHYEGYDERIVELLQPEELSLGDFVLSGGEPAAIAIVDAVIRLLPGALGHEDGAADESFNGGTLEYPQYTRPRDFRGLSVPDVLLSGNHAEIERWRRAQALQRTQRRRPDLLEGRAADDVCMRNDTCMRTDAPVGGAYGTGYRPEPCGTDYQSVSCGTSFQPVSVFAGFQPARPAARLAKYSELRK